MKTNFEQIVDISAIGKNKSVNLNEIIEMAGKEDLSYSIRDNIKRLLLCIDIQKDFVEGGSLAVPGSIGDIERITKFIYNNIEGITCIMCSLDTHIPNQIFHPCWWKNFDNEHPAPYTVITHKDVCKGIWVPDEKNTVKSLQYLEEIEKVGKKLTIWPYHCIKGTEGNSLENEFSKMVYFHSIARECVNPMVIKGEDPYSEMYGIISPEYSQNCFVNMEVLDAIKNFDEIFVVGEAASHCLLESVKQIAKYFYNRYDITQKITIFEDCTSPIPGYEKETEAAFNQLKNDYGIKVTKSTDIHINF